MVNLRYTEVYEFSAWLQKLLLHPRWKENNFETLYTGTTYSWCYEYGLRSRNAKNTGFRISCPKFYFFCLKLFLHKIFWTFFPVHHKNTLRISAYTSVYLNIFLNDTDFKDHKNAQTEKKNRIISPRCINYWEWAIMWHEHYTTQMIVNLKRPNVLLQNLQITKGHITPQ